MASRNRKRFFRAACLQVNAGADWRRNLGRIRRQIEKAAEKNPEVIALPENFAWRGPSKDLARIARESTPVVLRELAALAKKYGTAILAGSVIETSPASEKFYNTSVLISKKGEVTARYRKIHLFDIRMKKVSTRESRYIRAGREIVCGEIQGVRAGLRFGLSICYDLRFPELYRRLAARGCKIFFVPSNFTFETGRAHWEILLRARAVENQAFVIAPAQTGVSPSNGIRSFGTSLIVDPWGRVIARGSRTREQILHGRLDLEYQENLRKAFPVLRRRRHS